MYCSSEFSVSDHISGDVEVSNHLSGNDEGEGEGEVTPVWAQICPDYGPPVGVVVEDAGLVDMNGLYKKVVGAPAFKKADQDFYLYKHTSSQDWVIASWQGGVTSAEPKYKNSNAKEHLNTFPPLHEWQSLSDSSTPTI